MARRIYALMPVRSDEDFVCAIRRGENWVLSTAGSFTPRSDDRVTILVPGTDVTRHVVTLTARSAREALRAAPYTIEDELATPVEDIHVALGRTIDNEDTTRRVIYACSRECMETWIRRAGDAGMHRARFVADYAVLPHDGLVVDIGPRILVSDGSRRFALDVGVSDDVLRVLAANSDTPPTVIGRELAARLGLEPEGSGESADLRQLAAWGEAKDQLPDIRQSTYAHRSSASLADLSQWRIPAILAASCLVVWLSSLVLETSILKRRSSANLAEAQALYAAAFPDEGIVNDPARNIRAKATNVRETDAGADFMQLSAALYQAVMVADGVAIKSIRFERAAGDLRASLLYPDYGTDARIKAALVEAGFSARIGDTRQGNNGVLGELIIRRQP